MRGYSKYLIAAWLCLMAPPSLAEEELVVISASGPIPGIREGQIVMPSGHIAMPSASSLRLLSASGKVIEIIGPYSGPFATEEKAGPAPGGKEIIASLAGFLTARQKAANTLGAIRSAAPPRKLLDPDDPWMIVIVESGAQCAKPPEVTLWRKDASTEETLILRFQQDISTRLSWPAGKNSLDMGKEFAAGGQDFQAALGGKTSAITLHLLSPPLANPAGIANWLIEKGCLRQAKLYLDKLR